MKRDEMIAFIKANPYHQISHTLFSDNEYIYAGYDGYVYDENGNLFETWYDIGRWDGIRERCNGQWEDGWYVKTEVKTCQYFFVIPKHGICCGAYSESKPTKENRWRHWAHYPDCKEENCPLKHPELLEGRILESEV